MKEWWWWAQHSTHTHHPIDWLIHFQINTCPLGKRDTQPTSSLSNTCLEGRTNKEACKIDIKDTHDPDLERSWSRRINTLKIQIKKSDFLFTWDKDWCGIYRMREVFLSMCEDRRRNTHYGGVDLKHTHTRITHKTDAGETSSFLMWRGRKRRRRRRKRRWRMDEQGNRIHADRGGIRPMVNRNTRYTRNIYIHTHMLNTHKHMHKLDYMTQGVNQQSTTWRNITSHSTPMYIQLNIHTYTHTKYNTKTSSLFKSNRWQQNINSKHRTYAPPSNDWPYSTPCRNQCPQETRHRMANTDIM